MNLNFEKKGRSITTLCQWKEYGHPKSETQWSEGRSAFLMADFAVNHKEEFCRVIREILKECDIEHQDFNCEPEAVAGLGKGMKRGGSRNHDLLMVGTKNCVIGVEAKVSERFEDSFKKIYKKQGNNNNTRAFVLNKFLTQGKNVEDVGSIGYQLFTATRATMNSAFQLGLPNSIQLIIVFTGDVKKEPNYDKNCKKNEEDFDAFLKVTKAENGLIEREIEGKSVKCWIKKVKVRIPDYSIEK